MIALLLIPPLILPFISPAGCYDVLFIMTFLNWLLGMSVK